MTWVIIQRYYKLSVYFMGVLILFGFFFSCQSAKHTDNLKQEKNKLLYIEKFHSAGTSRMLGNTDKALQLYLDAVELDKSSFAAAYYAALLYYHKQSYELCLFYANKSVELNPEQLWNRFLLASAYQKTGQLKQSEKHYQILIKNFPKHKFLYKDLAELYLQHSKFDKTVDTYKVMVEQTFDDESYGLKLYRNIDSDNAARSELLYFLQETYTDTAKYDMLLADLYLNSNKKGAAEKIYNQYYQSESTDTLVLVSLINYFFNQRDTIAVMNLQNRLLNAEANFEIKLTVLDLQKFSTGDMYLKHLRAIFDDNTDNSEVNKRLGDYYRTHNMPDTAKYYYQTAYRKNKSSFQLTVSLLNVLFKTADFKALSNYSDTALLYLPNHPEIYFHKALGQLYTNQPDNALNNFITAESLTFNNSILINEILYYKCLVYFYKKNQQKFMRQVSEIPSYTIPSYKAIAVAELYKIRIGKGSTNPVKNFEKHKDNPDINFYHRINALALIMQNRKDEAIAYLEKNTEDFDSFTNFFLFQLKEENNFILLP